MTNFPRPSSRQVLTTAVLVSLAIAIAACSASSPLQQTLPGNVSPQSSSGSLWVFTAVPFTNQEINANTMATDISDLKHITGAYDLASTGIYNGYEAPCKIPGTAFVCGPYTLKDYPGSGIGTYVSGLDSGDSFEVGWVTVPHTTNSCSTCGYMWTKSSSPLSFRHSPSTVRATTGSGSGSGCFNKVSSNGVWCMFQDPNQGSGPCTVTELSGVNGVGEAVGYYETGSSKPCGKQAFGVYALGSSSGSEYLYYDIGDPAWSSSMASDIDDGGDVDGITTVGSGSTKQTYGFLYKTEQYRLFQCSSSSGEETYPTYALGISGVDEPFVVGYYTVGSVAHGFFIVNPKKGANSCTTVDFVPPNSTRTVAWTKVTGVDNHRDISGYFQYEGSSLTEGFVGYYCSGSHSSVGCKGAQSRRTSALKERP